VVCLIEDKQRARPEWAERLLEPIRIGLVGKQCVRNQEAGTDRPGIGRKAMRAANGREILAIYNGKSETELLRQLVLPLGNHSGRRRDQYEIDAAAQQQLAQDEASLDGLAKPYIIGNE
jgi:hypothetical protein